MSFGAQLLDLQSATDLRMEDFAVPYQLVRVAARLLIQFLFVSSHLRFAPSSPRCLTTTQLG
jgi:hypothetical protein